ncbi:MAG: DUF1573 domain-containing protein [Verrucomicrobia bacterium]|nr:MAG: DUF1573 domain-containing protein [Verrucomicrobiota bacterium]
MSISKGRRLMGLGLLLMGSSCLFGELAFETNEISMSLPPDKDRLSVEFPFKVKGAKPVTIKEYQAACSCLSAEISGNGKLTWHPGESGVVRGNFKLGTIKGAIEKKIVITLEGETVPIVLTAKLEIPDLFSIDPPTLFWDLDGRGDTQTFKVSVNHETDIMVTELTCTNEQFKYELKVIKPGREYQVAVTPVHVKERAFGLLRIKNDCEFKKYSSVQGFMVVRLPKPSS